MTNITPYLIIEDGRRTDYMATWPSRVSFHDGAQEIYGNTKLPPLNVLTHHAEGIIAGKLLASRLGGWTENWEPDVPLYIAVRDDPGWLDIEGKLRSSGGFDWRISFRVSAEPDNAGFSSSYMSPSLALAWMIAAVEEHERETRAGMIEHVGGLS